MSVRKIRFQDQIRWEVYVLSGGRGSKRMRRRFETKAEAEAFLEQYKQRKKKAKSLGSEGRDFEETTFREEANYWLERQGIRFSPGYMVRVKGILDEILPEFGHLSPGRLNPDRLSRFQSEQLAKGKRPATVNRKTEVITTALNFSVRHRRLPYNPTSGFRKLPEVREDMKFWERSEAAAFLSFALSKYPAGSPNRWIFVVYLLALNTAIRAGEIWGLQCRDLTSDGELLYIRRQWDLRSQSFRLPKGKKPRHVPCNELLRAELVRLIRGQPKEATVFRNSIGTPVDRDNFDFRVFKKDVKESGVKPIRFHDLRHTATTLMIAGGLDLRTVQEICGHQHVTTTMKYAHVLGDAVRDAGRRFSIAPQLETPVLQLEKKP